MGRLREVTRLYHPATGLADCSELYCRPLVRPESRTPLHYMQPLSKSGSVALRQAVAWSPLSRFSFCSYRGASENHANCPRLAYWDGFRNFGSRAGSDVRVAGANLCQPMPKQALSSTACPQCSGASPFLQDTLNCVDNGDSAGIEFHVDPVPDLLAAEFGQAQGFWN